LLSMLLKRDANAMIGPLGRRLRLAAGRFAQVRRQLKRLSVIQSILTRGACSTLNNPLLSADNLIAKMEE